MRSTAATVEEYLASLPEDRRADLSAVREVILKSLPEGYEEGIQYGMIGYYVPHHIHPAGYHCDPKQPVPFAALGSQKSYMVLHLMCVYGDGPVRRRFLEGYRASGKKLDMGAACVRFRKLSDLPLDVVSETIRSVPVKDYLAAFEAALAARKR